MTHYEVLGVAPSATQEELHRAYLMLVRRHHPDAHAVAPHHERALAEDAMRAINAAWHELGDRERRRRYDARLSVRPTAVVVDEQGTSSWQPYDDDADVVDDRLDDSLRPPPRGGRLLTMGPPVVLASGVSLLVAGAAVGLRPAVAVGAMGIIFGAALFLLAALAVVFESRRNDLR